MCQEGMDVGKLGFSYTWHFRNQVAEESRLQCCKHTELEQFNNCNGLIMYQTATCLLKHFRVNFLLIV